MKIVRVNDLNGAEICDKFLNQLIKFESDFDDLINSNFVVNNFYKKSLDNENINLSIAMENNKLVGYIFAYRKYEKNTSFKNDIIFIDGLFVDEKYRHSGIGTKLIKYIENWSREKYENPYIEITYIKSNINAEKCYKKLGYEPVREILRKKVK